LKKFSPSAFLRGRFPLAIIAGAVLAAAFPQMGIAGFAWIAPGLFLAVALGKGGGETFRLGYVAGFVHYLISLSWLLNIPVAWYPILGWIALAAFLALFPATWVWLSLRSLSVTRRPLPDWLAVTREIYALSCSQRMSWALMCAALWVSLEMLLSHIFGGFPWNLLADSQYRILPLIQFASFTGVFGISFLVVWTSVSLLCAVTSILGKPSQRNPWMAEIILPFTAVVIAFGYGFHQLRQPALVGRELKATLVQPSIPQTMIWDESKSYERFKELMELSDRALAEPADVLMWPEASLPGNPFDREGNIAAPIADLAREHATSLIIGADDFEIKPSETNFFNASFLIGPEGKLAGRYRKRGLVIFGEYIPLEHSLPFIKWFTPVTGSYTAGERPVQFKLERRAGAETGAPTTFQTSVLICFEDVFPNLARKSVGPETDFLVNITNDGWFGEGAAQWQQAAAATFRTVENGVPLIRCANTGITCWIDAQGRWQQIFNDRGNVYGKGFLPIKVPLPPEGKRHPQTFYNRYGDWFAWSCIGFAAIRLALGLKADKFSLSAT
jgi:apolipoprotein N-acyltransferase